MYTLLSKLKCRAIYVTGSTVIPFIKHPRDVEYCAIFSSKEEADNTPHIKNVHKIVMNDVPKVQSYSYLFHYLNHTTKYVGEKTHFNEVSIDEMYEYVQRLKRTNIVDFYPKIVYRFAIVEALKKYGYDIPTKVTDLINELHDYHITYEEYNQKLRDI